MDLKYNSFAESLLGKGAQLDIRNNDGVTSFDLFIDNIIKNKNDISFYSNAKNKESIETYQINVKQRDRLSSISELFIKHGIDELKYRDGEPALHKLKELGFYQSYCTSETRFKKRSNKKAIFYGAVGATFLTIGIGLAVASLYTDLRILIVVAAACIVAGYCIYQACQQYETVNSNLNDVPSVAVQLADTNKR